jgi:hypothetical protein
MKQFLAIIEPCTTTTTLNGLLILDKLEEKPSIENIYQETKLLEKEVHKLVKIPDDAVQEPTATIQLTEQRSPTITNTVFEPVETYEQYGQVYNIYKRETLYQEVWAKPVTEVAQHYKVSDVTIHKVCKALDVPTPAKGYWAKVRAGNR